MPDYDAWKFGLEEDWQEWDQWPCECGGNKEDCPDCHGTGVVSESEV